MHLLHTEVCKWAASMPHSFDQPPWWKVLLIIDAGLERSDLSNIIVLRLGGFHTDMGFLSSSGHWMDGSGLSSGARIYSQRCGAHDDREGNTTSCWLCVLTLVDGFLNLCLQLLMWLSLNSLDEQKVWLSLSNMESQRKYITRWSLMHRGTEMERETLIWMELLSYVHMMEGTVPAEKDVSE